MALACLGWRQVRFVRRISQGFTAAWIFFHDRAVLDIICDSMRKRRFRGDFEKRKTSTSALMWDDVMFPCWLMFCGKLWRLWLRGQSCFIMVPHRNLLRETKHNSIYSREPGYCVSLQHLPSSSAAWSITALMLAILRQRLYYYYLKSAKHPRALVCRSCSHCSLALYIQLEVPYTQPEEA